MTWRWHPNYTFLFATGLGLVLLWTAVIVFCRYDEMTTLAMVRRDSSYLSAVFAKDSAYTFETADRAILTIRDDLRRDPALKLSAETGRAEIFSNVIIAISTFDATGRILDSTLPDTAPVNIADRPYFPVLRTMTVDEPIIFGPVHGRISKRWAILLNPAPDPP
jgi:hypothetical protein